MVVPSGNAVRDAGGRVGDDVRMPPVPVLLLLALGVGLLLGGSLRNFEGLPMHWWGLAVAGLVLQAIPAIEVGDIPIRAIGAAFLVSSYVLLLAFLLVNRWIPGATVMIVGLLLNLAVVTLNGGMPVSAEAIERAGGSVPAAATSPSAKHHLMDEDSVLVPLADVIAVPPPVGIVLSFGDVLLYAGMMWFVLQVTRGRSRGNPRPLVPWFLSYRGKHAPRHWRMAARHRLPGRAGAERSGTSR
jgi:hypothetical protein